MPGVYHTGQQGAVFSMPQSSHVLEKGHDSPPWLRMAEIMRQWGTVIQAPIRVWMPGFQTYECAVGSRPSPSTSLNALVCTMKKSLWITVSLAGEFRGIWEPPTVKMKCVCVITHVRMSMWGLRVLGCISAYLSGESRLQAFPKFSK